MGKPYVYYDKDGQYLDEDRWWELHNDDDYWLLGRYQTDKVMIVARWDGRADPEDLQPTLFVVEQRWAISESEFKPDANPGTFRTLDQAMTEYRELVELNTQGRFDEDGDLVNQEDNLLKPKIAGALSGDYSFGGGW